MLHSTTLLRLITLILILIPNAHANANITTNAITTTGNEVDTDTMLCYTMLYPAMLSYAILDYAVLYYAMIQYAMTYYDSEALFTRIARDQLLEERDAAHGVCCKTMLRYVVLYYGVI